MKKMVALVLAGTMMAGMASVASATKNFDTPAWCNSTTNYTMADSEGDQKLNDTHAAIYVRHYDNVDTTEYTNDALALLDDDCSDAGKCRYGFHFRTAAAG